MNDSLEEGELDEAISNRACNMFLTKMIYDSSGKKSKIFIDRFLFRKIKTDSGEKINFKNYHLENLRSQDLESWIDRISKFQKIHFVSIPDLRWDELGGENF